ncbi:MAG: CHC2 zinc finger domain-containing protein [Polyangiaceae bacterium]
MARIPEEEIERLKREISLERLAEARGVKLKRHGADLMGQCPFHDDRTPSLVISPEKNLWHCLGACQAGGTVIDWVMRAEGVSFRHAVELLREGIPSLAAAAAAPVKRGRQVGKVAKHSTVTKLDAAVEQQAADESVLERVVSYYHETLKESPEALAYLASRGLRNSEMVERFRLGFANRTLGYRLPHKNRAAGAELRGQLERLGIYRESGHEHFNGSLVVPIFDEQGSVTEMYGRKVTPKLRPGTPLHLYMPGPHRGVWNIEAFQASREIILCEALIDALTFWCAGFRNVTAAYGVEGFTEDHWQALERYGTERVYIAYDRDDAGDRAAEKLATELMARGIECFRVLFPRGMDANSYALKVTPAEKSLGLVLRQAVWMGKGAAPTAPVVAEASELAAPVAAVAIEAEQQMQTEAMPESASPRAANEPPPPAPPAASPPAVALPPPAAPPPPAPTRRPSVAEISSLAAELSATVVTTPLISPPAAKPASLAADPRSSAEELVFQFGDRRWRIRGFTKNTSAEQLKINALVSREGGGFHVDNLELYSARQRGVFQKLAADELGVEENLIKRDLGELLLKLETRQEETLRAALEPKKSEVVLTEVEQEAALKLLKDPRLVERILEDFERSGVVGERVNKLVGYLGATSRKLDRPLAVIIQSSSAAGKSSLMDAVLALMPEEECIQYSAMTGQSLFYMGDKQLEHKILAIVEEQGAERAAYALKLLQSEGELTIASTGKDPTTGRLVTEEYRVTGPVMIFLTTTAIEVDEELLNRCLILSVDEGREQTRKIHERQREAETLEGLVGKRERDRIRNLHQNAQRLLRPLPVVNPFARELGFLDTQTRTRRDFPKYLTLIRTITLLHQYQRRVLVHRHRGEELRYIEVTREDIRLANELTHEVLGRSLDELPPQTRRLLGLVDAMVRERTAVVGVERRDFRFSRREVREATGYSYEQLRVHLGRLVELEYLLVHRGGRGQSFFYELLYDGGGASGAPRVFGLIEVGADAAATTPTLGGDEGGFGEPLGAQTGAKPGGLLGEQRAAEQHQNSSIHDRDASGDENTRPGSAANAERGGEVVALPRKRTRSAPERRAAEGR